MDSTEAGASTSLSVKEKLAKTVEFITQVGTVSETTLTGLATEVLNERLRVRGAERWGGCFTLDSYHRHLRADLRVQLDELKVYVDCHTGELLPGQDIPNWKKVRMISAKLEGDDAELYGTRFYRSGVGRVFNNDLLVPTAQKEICSFLSLIAHFSGWGLNQSFAGEAVDLEV